MPRKPSQSPAEASPEGTSPLRERILNAAFTTFMERGYAGTSTSEIAKRARASKRELYSEFGSKQAILVACIDRGARQMRQPLRLPPASSAQVFRATLVKFGETFVRAICQPHVTATFRLAIIESDGAGDVAQALEAVRTDSRAALMGLFSEAQANRLVGAGDPGDMVSVFYALLMRGNLQLRLLLGVAEPPSDEDVHQRAVSAADGVLAIYPPRA
jgi:AcrR family transcriptional regulator